MDFFFEEEKGHHRNNEDCQVFEKESNPDGEKLNCESVGGLKDSYSNDTEHKDDWPLARGETERAPIKNQKDNARDDRRSQYSHLGELERTKP